MELRAAVVGTGFAGLVHVDALRRLGVEVTGVVGSTPERARAAAEAHGLPRAYESFEAMLADPAVDVVHLASPNDVHHPQARAAIAAGKHCVCEKPLAVSSAESAELAALAEASGLVCCTNFNLRFYPQVQEARQRVLAGEVGAVWDVHGAYLQDWLHDAEAWNWRLDPARGGAPRVVADIGSHWLDAAQFVTGLRIESVLADLAVAVPVRPGPAGPVEVETEDIAHVLVRFGGGARGSVVLSQVAAGRRNRISIEVDGAAGAIAWESERNEELWLGHRGRPNETLWRDPLLMEGPVRGSVPAGHAEGYQDSFKELYRAVYRAVAAGAPADDYPSFRDGHVSNVLAEAVLRSHRERRWIDV